MSAPKPTEWRCRFPDCRWPASVEYHTRMEDNHSPEAGCRFNTLYCHSTSYVPPPRARLMTPSECEACHVGLEVECIDKGIDSLLDSEREAHHALLAEKDARIRELVDAILYTTELYPEPVRYKTSKGLKPNLSIGFETRYQAMYDLAIQAALARSEGGT